jgi:hypothetical protein
VSKIEGDGEMLTGARIRAALTCREVGGEVRRQFVGGSRGGVDAEGFRDSWAPRVDSWSSCDEAKGGQGGWEPTGGEKSSGGQNSPQVKSGAIPARHGTKVEARASGSVLGLRRS